MNSLDPDDSYNIGTLARSLAQSTTRSFARSIDELGFPSADIGATYHAMHSAIETTVRVSASPVLGVRVPVDEPV